MSDNENTGQPAGRKIRILAGTLLVAAGAITAFASLPGAEKEQANTASVAEGEFAVRSVYNGKLESRTVVTIMSQFNGTATVVELAEEGAPIAKGRLLVRFDDTQLRRDIVKLEKEHELSRSELKSLTNAKLPLELRELEMQLMELEAELAAETAYLEDSITLREEDLVSVQEVKDQERKVRRLESKLDTLKLEHELTREYLHPAMVDSARAKLHSAEQALNLARRQLEATEVRAPKEGVVVYKSLHIGGEFRAVRVGDSLYPNQPFMVIPDMDDLVVRVDVPESELSNVTTGRETYIKPLAYPDLTLPGTVEAVGSVAQTLPDHPGWQKFFHVRIGVDRVDPSIRPGMSVTAYILSHHKKNAVLIPRRAVSWDRGTALTRIVDGSSHATRQLSLGPANETHYEVLAGVQPGDEVLIR